jgi:hypothetical protein
MYILDPGFRSSAFGEYNTELLDGVISVLHAEDYPGPEFNRLETQSNYLMNMGLRSMDVNSVCCLC